MKNTLICLIAFILFTATFTGKAMAQEENKKNDENLVLYMIIANVVPNDFKFPMIGFINVARGDNKSLQFSFINTTLGSEKGMQFGFINTTLKDFKGFQFGFINTTLKDFKGFQFGFINTVVNGLNGLQLGFINYAENADSCIPVGFVSIVRDGGYRALEFSFNDIAPYNLTFKIGVPKFYTFFQVAYNSKNVMDNSNFGKGFVMGAGTGTIIDMGKKFNFNPEAILLNTMHNTQIVRFAPSFRYNILPRLSVGISPSFSWLTTLKNREINEASFALIQYKIDRHNLLAVGLQIGLTFNITPLE